MLKFFEKHWAHLALLGVCATGLILSAVLLSRADLLYDTPFALPFGARSLWVGYLVFSIGVGTWLVLRMIKIPAMVAHSVLILTGLLVSIFMFIAMGEASGAVERVFADHPATREIEGLNVLIVLPIVIQWLVFGLFTTIMGARRLLNSYHIHHARKKQKVK